MPSSPFRHIVRGPTISDILKFIPQTWKQPPRLIPGTSEIQHVSLFKSLGDFAANGHLHEAFRTFSLLRHQSSSAGSSDFILYSTASLLSACVDVNEFVPGLQIHAHCISSGLEFNPILVSKLVTFYSAFNLLEEAQTITENSDILDSLPWNVLIASYIGRKRLVEAVTTYKRMVSKGIRPDAFTYPSVLKACGELLDFATGRVVHGSIEVSSHRGDLYVCNALISMYKKFGKVCIARSLFDMMPKRDAVSWNAVINCYASEGMWEEALKLFDGMQFSGVEASVVTWNTIAGGCLQTENYLGALSVVAKMRKCNVRLDPVAVIIGLKACSYIGALQWGRIFHCLAIQSSYNRIDNVRNSLITMYSRCDDLRHALTVFQQTEANSLTTWNSIISGFAYNERSEEAAFLLKEMLLAGIHPNYVTLASLVPLCAKVSNLQHGKEFHCYILRRQSFKDCLILWNSLVDMYAKSRKLKAAKRVCDSMSNKDKVTYTSLIDGYGMIGEGRVALVRFEEMIKSGMKPDHVTMVAVLSACSHSNLVQEGQSLFENMQYVFGISPRLGHFSCMVDLYSRVGLLAKAIDIIRITPYEPSTAMWATLLKACLSHRNTHIGEWVADKLLEMMPENIGCYVLIANMYAAAGSWSKYEKVWTFMRDLGVFKAPEFGYVETGSGFSQSSINGSNETIADGVVGCVINQEQSSDEERLAETG